MWTKESLSIFNRDGGIIVVDAAKQKGDYTLLPRIQNYDLFACEAMYHNSCKKSYVNNHYITTKNSANKKEQLALESAHKSAYDSVVNYVNITIV